MKLNFKKVDNQICPIIDSAVRNYELVEDVIKCTVSSSSEQGTVMTLTVSVIKKEKTDEQ